MKANDKLHGFTVLYAQEIPEIKATLYRMQYDKNKADLVWLDRKDDNKTFAIGFKTIPQDHTGVFHILEHSVLCGSDKYPLKEPFVDLLKCSLQTFLNAMTYPDKTVYPLSSRNDQDFLNLMDVYLDATLHPVIVHDPHAFRQEGWHYELDSPDGELRRNGVVYNEMKGAYATGDSVLMFELNKALAPDNCYSMESGGHPDHIPELTYENYLASYKRFYHPSNSRIFLDGSVDIDAALEKIDSFLKDFDYLEVNADIPMQAPVHPAESCAEYEIGPDDDGTNKVLLGAAWNAADFDDQLGTLTAAIVCKYLAGSNESPLKKAILENELAEDLELDFQSGVQQQPIYAIVRNTSADKIEKVWETVDKVFAEIAEKGLDRDQLEAIINNYEFKMREKDYGRMPRGLVFGLSLYDTWLYGGDPAMNLDYSESFKALRDGLKTDYFENWVRSKFINNPHQGRVRLMPSNTLGEEKRKAEAEEMAAIKASWTKEQIDECIESFRILRERQNAADTPENKAKLPTLSLADIPETVSVVPQTVSEVKGRTVLHQDIDTSGIVYLSLYFDISDMSLEKLSKINFLGSLLGQVGTVNYSPIELRSQIDGNLGQFSVTNQVFSAKGDTENCKPYLIVNVSVLESKTGEAARLIKEVLGGSSFEDGRFIYNMLRQSKLTLEQYMMMAGNYFGFKRVSASFSAKGAVNEAMSGISFLRWLQNADKTFAENGEAILSELKDLAKDIFVRERVTVSVTGPMDEAFVGTVLDGLDEGKPAVSMKYESAPVKKEGFVIPAEISFAVKSANLNAVAGEYSGTAAVVSQMLSYGYLWDTIRVKGGAYGTSYTTRDDGDVAFFSYRDPGAPNSLKSYDKASEALRAICDSDEKLDNYIISTIGESEPVLSPRLEGNRAAEDWLSGRSTADREKTRREILHTDKKALGDYADMLDKLCDAAGICVIGGKVLVDACELDTVEPIQQ